MLHRLLLISLFFVGCASYESTSTDGEKKLSLDHSTSIGTWRCVESNSFGSFARGGGCNMHGCFPPGGNCNMFGCSAKGECTMAGCPQKIDSYECVK